MSGFRCRAGFVDILKSGLCQLRLAGISTSASRSVLHKHLYKGSGFLHDFCVKAWKEVFNEGSWLVNVRDNYWRLRGFDVACVWVVGGVGGCLGR